MQMKLRKSRMVGDVPMDVIYRGMSLERLSRLNEIEYDAWFAAHQDYQTTDGETFRDEQERQFRKMLDRAAVKAAWNRNNRKASK